MEELKTSRAVSRRRFLALAASTAGGAILAACGQETPGPTSAAPEATPTAEPKPTEAEAWTMTFASVIGEGYPFYEARKELWEEWQESHPNVKIDYEYIPYDQFQQQLVTRALAGDAPHLAQAGYQTAQFASADLLVEITPYIERDNIDLDNWWPALIEIAKFDDKIWAAPFTIDTRFTYVNPGLYEEAGLEYPETWDDVLASAESFRDLDAHSVAMVMTGDMLGIWQTGASLIKQTGSDFIKVNPDGTASANLDTKEAVEMIEYLLALQEASAVPESFLTDSSGECESAFAQERVASYPIGNWMIGVFKGWREEGTMEFEEECIHHPIKRQKGAAAGGWDWYIFKTIKDPNVGWDFVSFFLKDENINRGWADGLSPTKSGMETSFYTSEPKNAFVSEVMEYSTWPVPPVAGWSEIMPVIWKNVMKANSGQMSPEAAMKEGQVEVQRLLDEGHNKLLTG